MPSFGRVTGREVSRFLRASITARYGGINAGDKLKRKTRRRENARNAKMDAGTGGYELVRGKLMVIKPPSWRRGIRKRNYGV